MRRSQEPLDLDRATRLIRSLAASRMREYHGSVKTTASMKASGQCGQEPETDEGEKQREGDHICSLDDQIQAAIRSDVAGAAYEIQKVDAADDERHGREHRDDVQELEDEHLHRTSALATPSR